MIGSRIEHEILPGLYSEGKTLQSKRDDAVPAPYYRYYSNVIGIVTANTSPVTNVHG